VKRKKSIDQRVPLEFVTDSFLPSETSARSNKFKKTLLLVSKTGRQRLGQDRRSEPDTGIFVFGMKLWKGCFI